MKKASLLLPFLLAFAAICTAQVNYQDVIYLKNDSVVRGVIAGQIPGTSIKVETPDGNLTEYSLDEVSKIKRERVARSVSRKPMPFNPDSISQHSFGVLIETGGLFGFKANDESGNFFKYNTNFFTLMGAAGYRVSRKLFLGAGAGVEVNETKHAQIPIFATVHYSFLNKKVSPFLNQKFGAAFLILPINKNYRADGSPIGGATLQTQAGVRVYLGNKTAIQLGALYRFQHFRGNILVNETYRISYYSAAHYFGFTAGVLF